MWEIPTSAFYLHLLSYNQIFIIELIKGTAKIASAQKTPCIIFVHIHHAHITFVVLIILIITTCITTAHS